jgi:uncharacterized protein (DUF2141 family)
LLFFNLADYKTMRYFFQVIIICAICITWLSCANEVSPTGGPTDTTPPKLLARSMQDSMLRFTGGKIEFDFDEKIDEDKIVIETFPLMKTKPKITVNKKKLSIAIPDSLLEKNTTYKISLGNSIKDIYEGTALDKLQFIFATGDVLDTMQLNGSVLKANSGEVDTSAWVLLYTSIQSDSDVSNKRPLYAVKTDQFGGFSFTNLPNKEFYLYAISDINKNLKYDAPLESIGFMPTTVLPVNDLKTQFVLRIFQEINDSANANRIALQKSRMSETSVFSINIDSSDSKRRTFDITKPIMIVIPQKIKAWQANRIRLYADSILDETGIVTLDTIKNAIIINADLAQDAKYKLVLLDSFASDTNKGYKGNTFLFRTKKEADYGTLKIKYLLDKKPYPVMMQLHQNANKIAEQLVTDSLVEFKLLQPGNYTIKILNDENNNGKWDNGQYYGNKKQPESIEKLNVEAVVKANWQNMIEWKKSSK